jgi:hypothetical protein
MNEGYSLPTPQTHGLAVKCCITYIKFAQDEYTTSTKQRHFIKGIKRLSQSIMSQPNMELEEIVQKKS